MALRSLSVIAMGGAALTGVLFVRRYFGVKAALGTLGFVVVAPFLLRYGFEIRGYALASLIGIAATYVLVSAVEAKHHKRQRLLYVVYAVLVAIGMYTLYYTAVLWIAHVVWLVWRARSRKEPILRQSWWAGYVGAAALFLPWLPTFLSQWGSGALAPIAQQLTVENMVGIVSFWFLYQSSAQLNGFWSLVIVAVIASLIYLAVMAFRLVLARQKPYLVLLGFYTAVPVVVVALISLYRPMYVERYLAHVLIGAILFTGVAVALLWQKRRPQAVGVAVFLGVVLVCGVAQLIQVGNYNFQRHQTPHIREVAEALDCKDHPMVIAESPYEAIEISYYADGCDVRFFSENDTFIGGYAPLSRSDKRVEDINKVADKNFIYIYYDEPKQTIPASLKTVKDETFSAIHVRKLEAH
ncbi:MAG TPA: glycosyltransferase family 39 protein [Candidatus Saccharimonadales bacterium]|nr:glycosyltransferase family 39 protein [Candidatus Saccharimonadales bacterium]